MKSRSTLLVLALLTFLTAAGSSLFYFNYTADVAEREMRTSAAQTAEIMAGELDVSIQYYQRTLEAFVRLPQLQRYDLLHTPSSTEIAGLLQLLCDSVGGNLCYVLDPSGTVSVANGQSEISDFVGQNFAFRPYFKQAQDNEQAVYLAKGVHTGQRGIYFAQRISSAKGLLSGVVVAKVPPGFMGLDFQRFDGRALLVAPDELIFATNHNPWLLKTFQPLESEGYARLRESRQFGDVLNGSVGLVWQGGRLLDASNTQYLAGSADVSSLPGWKALYLIDEMKSGMRAAESLGAYVLGSFALVILIVVILLYRVAMRDQTSRESAEKALRESETRLRRLSEVSNEAIIIHHDGLILDANSAAEVLFGYDRIELMTADVWQLFDDESREIAHRKENEDSELPYEVVGLNANGEPVPLEITAKKTFLEGQHVRVACIRNISNRKDQEAHIRFLAMFDNLTQLPNRHNLLQQLDDAIHMADRFHNPLYLMFIDLDDFKKVNDTLGHAAGDRLLIAVASRMQKLVAEGEVLARYGGDEFLVLLQNASEARVQRLADKVLDVLQQPFVLEGGTFYISGSVGIARYPEDASSSVDLLRKADTAMYSSKDAGRNAWNFFNADMNEEIAERMLLEQNLRHALERNELYIDYQPVFFAGDQHVVAAEALLRWRNPELGFVGPDRFIPVAEHTGMIEEIGRWVMEQACFQAAYWRQQGLDPFYISVNLSPRQFRDPMLIEFVADLLKRSQLPASALVFELTEGVLIRDDERSQVVINALAELGVGLAMDDFGTGYSSLSYLKRFPFNTLKIDREFVRDLEEDPGDQQLVVATVAMARALGMRVVAEGVENEAQQNFLCDTGVNYLQGYLLSRPISPQQFEQKFLNVEPENLPPEREIA